MDPQKMKMKIKADETTVQIPDKRIKYNRHSQLPPKYDMLLKLFDALDASLRLLRLRKSIPVYTKITPVIEKISDRRFTYHHLAQFKFLLPEEMHIKRVLIPDEETRCMKYDLHVSCNASMMSNARKRKRRNKYSCLKDRFLTRLWQFIRTHPEGTEVPEVELPEPFFNQGQDTLLNTSKDSSSFSQVREYSEVDQAQQPVQASHLSFSFKKHFSKGDTGINLGNFNHSPSNSSLQSSLNSVSKPSMNENEPEPLSVAVLYQTGPSDQSALHCKQKPFDDNKTCSAEIDQVKAATPTKSAGTPFSIATPALKTPKRSSMNPDDNFSCSPKGTVGRSSCARSLRFDDHTSNLNIELQVEEAECSKILDILPENLLQSVREKEKIKTEQSDRKLLITKLPKLFDRIHYLFQSPKHSAIRKEALIRNLTERHCDITEESEVVEQLKLLQEIIPEWISSKLSPSGNILYSINKRLNPSILRLRIDKAM